MTRAVFLGSPPAAVPSLAAAASCVNVVGVITQPDRPKGRRGDPVPTAVKEAALDWGIDLYQPSAGELKEVIDDLRPDVGVVVAYGKLLKPEVLAVPTHGFVNVHFSLLPRWRGAAPVQAAIAAGDSESGVSIMRLDEGLDTGPVVTTASTPIASYDTGGRLTARLAGVGADLLADALPRLLAGELTSEPQDDAGATHAPRLEPSDARLDPGQSAEELERKVRAFQPRPGAWLDTADGRIKIHAVTVSAEDTEPGVIAATEEVRLGTRSGSLVLHTIQPAGKNAMDARAWMNGRRNQPVTVL
ncbi:MAG: methionyl-tRNA formyltransferase [Acidimicrobiia bacterium]|nr:methionyl-tRNA formyltransferase [Acidimicrobiia bacterium]